MLINWGDIMKKVLRVLIIITGCFIVLTLIVFNLFGLKEIDSKDVKQINFISMPSPPKKKTINNDKEIESIISIINESRKNFCGFYTEAGWQGFIELPSGKKLILLNNSIIYNNFKYSLTKEKYKKLFSIYEKSDVIEEVCK